MAQLVLPGRALLGSVERELGYTFRDKTLLMQALTHASAATGRLPSYEKLEYLGDRVLGLVMAEILLRHFPDEDEGQLTKREAGLVQRSMLAGVARKLGLHRSVIPQKMSGNEAVLEDVFEAVVGAIYKDAGLAEATAFVKGVFLTLLDSGIADAKSELQEFTQGRDGTQPCYSVVQQSGPENSKVFVCEVSACGLTATGTASAKRQAEIVAARQLIGLLKHNGVM